MQNVTLAIGLLFFYGHSSALAEASHSLSKKKTHVPAQLSLSQSAFNRRVKGNATALKAFGIVLLTKNAKTRIAVDFCQNRFTTIGDFLKAYDEFPRKNSRLNRPNKNHHCTLGERTVHCTLWFGEKPILSRAWTNVLEYKYDLKNHQIEERAIICNAN